MTPERVERGRRRLRVVGYVCIVLGLLGVAANLLVLAVSADTSGAPVGVASGALVAVVGVAALLLARFAPRPQNDA